MSPNPLHRGVFLAFFFILLLPTLLALPQLDPSPIQPFLPIQAPPSTIPAFPEQSDLAGCPLDLPDELFHGVRTACGGNANNGHPSGLKRSRCCPVLAAWLYFGYSATALGRAARMPAERYDLPLLPDDSETCVGNLENAFKGKGIELFRPNETCDLVYCYCGIRLRPWSCPEAFSVSKEGKLVAGNTVKKLEKDCFNVNGYTSLSGCSKCLNRLYQLNEEKAGNSSKPVIDRKSKMHNRDCELMGLTWLLSKNRTAYISTVSAVLRVLMMNTEGSDPRSCTLNSDGMPLAVDSSELDDPSSANILPYPLGLTILSLSLAYYVCIFLTSRF
ncbi:PREDICTED: uncharacterized GPI-anchored protein At4g28100-like [Nelumbo nucifera]|uniref:Uncharacterized GPI-anchored protein At4g28100-like n=2 Tax=Nelumbo nucifera TaxID=4432 RepID=A0A1U8B1X0_NELNU|nr:PREDICTED: uncharacterized GPI-anchored protein At4g28100-like [Nelumbo nucifera]DAD32049.1 TPA_asm: hypothetical protein HUJ06_010900 [Nelumbo nucifera]